MPEEQDTTFRAFTTPPGGIMTREVGAITGQVEAWLEGEHVRIRYLGARDVYTVTGATQGRTIDEIVGILTTDPGLDQYNNPRTVDLTRQTRQPE